MILAMKNCEKIRIYYEEIDYFLPCFLNQSLQSAHKYRLFWQNNKPDENWYAVAFIPLPVMP